MEVDEDFDDEDFEAIPAPGPAQLLEPVELDPAGLSELRSDILKKILSADSVLAGRFKGARGGWVALVGRVVAQGADEEDGKEMDAIVDYAAEDFRTR